MESRQPRFLRDQSRQAAGRRGWKLALSLPKGWIVTDYGQLAITATVTVN